MKSDLSKYLALKIALVNEKATLEARLTAINKVLGGDVSVATASPILAAPTTTPKGKRTFSAATKAKMAAAQKARWAKLKGNPDTTKAAAPATPPAAKKAKRTISPEAKARMVAGAKKRWAKVNAAKTAAKTGGE